MVVVQIPMGMDNGKLNDNREKKIYKHSGKQLARDDGRRKMIIGVEGWKMKPGAKGRQMIDAKGRQKPNDEIINERTMNIEDLAAVPKVVDDGSGHEIEDPVKRCLTLFFFILMIVGGVYLASFP